MCMAAWCGIARMSALASSERCASIWFLVVADLFHGEAHFGDDILKGSALVVLNPLLGACDGAMFLFADLFVFQRCPGQSVRNGVQHRFQQKIGRASWRGRVSVPV